MVKAAKETSDWYHQALIFRLCLSISIHLYTSKEVYDITQLESKPVFQLKQEIHNCIMACYFKISTKLLKHADVRKTFVLIQKLEFCMNTALQTYHRATDDQMHLA